MGCLSYLDVLKEPKHIFNIYMSKVVVNHHLIQDWITESICILLNAVLKSTISYVISL